MLRYDAKLKRFGKHDIRDTIDECRVEGHAKLMLLLWFVGLGGLTYATDSGRIQKQDESVRGE